MISFSIPVKTESEANKREHWAVKAKRAKRQRDAAYAMRQKITKYEIPLPIVVKLTRVGKRKLDDDNLARSFKAIRDGIADALGLDDGDERIRWHYAQKTGEYSVDVVIA